MIQRYNNTEIRVLVPLFHYENGTRKEKPLQNVTFYENLFALTDTTR